MRSSFRKPQTVRRYTGGHYDDNGEWVSGSYEEMTIMASVQPLSSQESARLNPEGAVNFNGVKIYSETPLRTDKQELMDGTSLVEADRLLWHGKLWKIIICEPWQSDVINHYKMLAVEKEPDIGESREIAVNQ